MKDIRAIQGHLGTTFEDTTAEDVRMQPRITPAAGRSIRNGIQMESLLAIPYRYRRHLWKEPLISSDVPSLVPRWSEETSAALLFFGLHSSRVELTYKTIIIFFKIICYRFFANIINRNSLPCRITLRYLPVYQPSWLNSKNIRVLNWPVYSPDLNPIENI